MGTTKREVSRLIDRNRAGYIVVVVALLALAFVIHRPDRKSVSATKAVGVEPAAAEMVGAESDATVSGPDNLPPTPKKKKRSRKSSSSGRKANKPSSNTPKSSRPASLSPLDSPL